MENEAENFRTGKAAAQTVNQDSGGLGDENNLLLCLPNYWLGCRDSVIACITSVYDYTVTVFM